MQNPNTEQDEHQTETIQPPAAYTAPAPLADLGNLRQPTFGFRGGYSDTRQTNKPGN